MGGLDVIRTPIVHAWDTHVSSDLARWKWRSKDWDRTLSSLASVSHVWKLLISQKKHNVGLNLDRPCQGSSYVDRTIKVLVPLQRRQGPKDSNRFIVHPVYGQAWFEPEATAQPR
ncbi:hypothetical protein HPP92_023350 [Vanilla planifolia]|uniref:Uncharacterized protein n=1 Tax=Vanilla planifolia TaxID=51239 RepID=A0A835UFZ6_VANPL|nr:hypothetical protein HPP92_023350 [Vanilla planifolia]